MHAMNASQASNRLSGEISAPKDLIVALGLQVAQITNELNTERNELVLTKD
jgi:hypothetical protein